MIIGSESNKFLPLIEFALGVEVAQVIIVLVVLLLGSFIQNVLNVSKRIWVIVISSIIIGLVIPMLLTR